MTQHEQVQSTSGDDGINAWLYRPAGPGPAPLLVMAHGLGAVRAMRLDAYAERFGAAGYVHTLPGIDRDRIGPRRNSFGDRHVIATVARLRRPRFGTHAEPVDHRGVVADHLAFLDRNSKGVRA